MFLFFHALAVVKVSDGADRFDFNLSTHYHLKCEKCGGVFDVSAPYLSDMSSLCEHDCDLEIKEHTLFFTGLYKNCKHS